jgi:SagB-type dehydrogenase family enzyme
LDKAKAMEIKLPEPKVDSQFSLEQSLAHRRSIRQFIHEPLSLSEISQLLWAAQGITHPSGYRTAPSAGALYPLEVYLAAGLVEELQPGIYHYQPHPHQLLLVSEGDIRRQLTSDALGQKAIAKAPAILVITAVYRRTTRKYGQRGIQYIHLDAGHAAQNICLQATALSLGTVPIGAFHEELVAQTLNVAKDEIPLYILPVGKHST